MNSAGTRGEACLPGTENTTVFGNHFWRLRSEGLGKDGGHFSSPAKVAPPCGNSTNSSQVTALKFCDFHPFPTLRNSNHFHFYVSSENSFTYFIHSSFIITRFQIFIFKMHSMNKPASIYQRWRCDIRDPAGCTTQEPMTWVLPDTHFRV